MTLVEKYIESFKKLPEEKQVEVIDFIEFLQNREERKMDRLMASIIADNNETLLALKSFSDI